MRKNENNMILNMALCTEEGEEKETCQALTLTQKHSNLAIKKVKKITINNQTQKIMEFLQRNFFSFMI
jgi:hypothetical protein